MENLNEDVVNPKEQIPRYETFNTFFTNPHGKCVSFGNRQMVLDGLYTKYAKLYEVKSKEFKLRILRIGKDLFFQIAVPSETVDNLTYDVVIHFVDGVGKSNLANTEVKVFSNSPSFVFTYAYAFHAGKLLVKDLVSKMSSTAITTVPIVKNTELVTGFEKTLFYAYFYITLTNPATKSDFFNKMAVGASSATLKKLVKSTDEKDIEYRTLKKAMSTSKKLAKSTTPTKKIKLSSVTKNKVVNLK